MKFFTFSNTHQSVIKLFVRILRILRRYGVSYKKMELNLNLYLSILQKKNVIPTFPITADALDKHPKLIKRLYHNGVEFAVHGYKHVDHSRLSRKALLRHIEKAIKIFEKHDIPFSGFRFPYLKYNKNFFYAYKNSYFKWSSNHTILWNVKKNFKMSNKNWQAYQTMLKQYNYERSDHCISLPRFLNNVLEIPVSLPDDDLLVDRMGLSNEKLIAEIWKDILSQAYSRGELFTLQLHPERISYCKGALETLIKISKASRPKIWIASLKEICDWWSEKNGFSFKLKQKNRHQYEVEVNCPPRNTLLVRSPQLKNDKFFNGYRIIKDNKFTVNSQKRPVVGIPNKTSKKFRNFLRNEGIIFEESEERENYSIYLDTFNDFSTEDEIKVLGLIHSTKYPFIRFWRWPNGNKSALSITGDIDALTSIDFFYRLLKN